MNYDQEKKADKAELRERIAHAELLIRNNAGVGSNPIRVFADVARHFLIENKRVVINETLYHLQIKKLGLGVYEISLAPPHFKSTRIVKGYSFDKTAIDPFTKN